MNTCVRIITIIVVLLAASNGFASLSGDWRLQIEVTSPWVCSFRDTSVQITQVGTLINGSATLLPLGPVCPITLTGTMNGYVIGDPTLPPFGEFVFPWEDPNGGVTIAGLFRDGNNAGGTFNGTYFNTPVQGNWTLVRISSTTVPTTTPWGRITLIVLAGLGALYYLRRRRMAVS
jgi:hypothetical protein